MLDSLETGVVSKIYSTDYGFAIAIKTDERYISTKFNNCKERLIYQNAEKFYSNWVQGLRAEAFIKIYHEKLY